MGGRIDWKNTRNTAAYLPLPAFRRTLSPFLPKLKEYAVPSAPMLLKNLLPLLAAAWLCMLAARMPQPAAWGISPLTIAIAAGMLLGNTLLHARPQFCQAGTAFAKAHLLRIGIALYGFRLTLAQLAYVGWPALLADVFIVAGTLWLAVRIGKKLGLDSKTAALVGSGSAICGAAAVLAAQPVLKAEERDVGVAVATVVVFGTLAMFAYPLMALWLLPAGAGDAEWFAWGIYTGASVHEVAQVAAAGAAVNPVVADVAVITKMIRVMLLAPVLVLLPWLSGTGNKENGKRWVMPWFVPAFLAAIAFNSLVELPAAVHQAILDFDTLLLTTAMFALGLTTRWQAVRAAGVKPLLLAGILAAWLLVGGGAAALAGYWLFR